MNYFVLPSACALFQPSTNACQKSIIAGPSTIRHALTEGQVRGSDRRANFVGVEAYEAASGVVFR